MKHLHDGTGDGEESPPPLWKQPLVAAVIMIALIGAFYLLREHWDHLVGNWVYLLLLACPLMHLFHGHGGHGRQTRPDLPGPRRNSDRT